MERLRRASLALAVFVAAWSCQSTGDIRLPDAGHDAPAETVDAEEAAADPVLDGDDADAGCTPESSPSGSQGHRAGQDCLGCHASQPESRRWTVAGTLFDAASGGAAVSGATIIVEDAEGTVIELVTHPNGNFYTTQSVTLPLTVAASRCPDHAVMGSGATSGSCNSCHVDGSRIHLP